MLSITEFTEFLFGLPLLFTSSFFSFLFFSVSLVLVFQKQKASLIGWRPVAGANQGGGVGRQEKKTTRPSKRNRMTLADWFNRRSICDQSAAVKKTNTNNKTLLSSLRIENREKKRALLNRSAVHL